jgi:O-antigen/teichoic acid export membrane protein
MAWILALINIRIQTYSRAHQDKRLSVLRVTQSAAVLTAQIVLGLLYVETGLIFGSLAGLLVVLFRVWPPKESLKKPQNASVVNVWQQQARKMQPSILLNVAYLHLQPVLINALFGAHVTGLFTLTQRLVQAPAQMLMGAIRLVWQREAKQHQQTGPGAFFAFYRQSVTRLAWQLALPVLLLCGLGAQIIEPLFGSRWLGMADILIWLGFAAAAQAMFSPVSGIIDLTKKATISLWLNLWFIFGVAAAWIAGYAYGRFNLGLQLMTWVIIFGYMASVFYFWQLLKLAAQDHKQHDKLD